MTDLYKISRLTTKENTFSAEVSFDASHPVFAGHFPGQPIVPGVVLVEISAAIISRVIGMEMIVKEASVIKFLQVIDPGLYPLIMINGLIAEEDSARYKVDLTFSSGSLVFAKIRGLRLVSE
jgi:3-hydroxyacyl-[acyl-carrier-protein] dehydratase